MKVALGSRIIEGPFGGGNTFIKNFSNYLIKNGHKVVYDLNDKDIDIILLTNPLIDSTHSTFNHIDIDIYQSKINKKSISVQRINECDERKGTDYVNKAILNSNKNIDHTIFVSNWLKEVYQKFGMKTNNSSVILGGSDPEVFNGFNKSKWNGYTKINLVTHHWSDNWLKGFETYKMIDELLDKKTWSKKLNFTYIGNYPKDIVFRNTKLVNPLFGNELAEELKKHHIYITGSLNEPSGNHHVEAGLCKLPMLYINSGGVTEYCKEFGVEFNNNNLEERLNYLISNYESYYSAIKNYNFTSEKMSNSYMNLFISLQKSRLEISENRINEYILTLFIKKILFQIKKYNNKIIYYFQKLSSK